jgi:hypothetical protein
MPALSFQQRFYDCALTASGAKDLMTGINEFLHESIVIPPGDWYRHGNVYDLLPQHALEEKSAIIRRKKAKSAQKGLEHYGESFGEAPATEMVIESGECRVQSAFLSNSDQN